MTVSRKVYEHTIGMHAREVATTMRRFDDLLVAKPRDSIAIVKAQSEYVAARDRAIAALCNYGKVLLAADADIADSIKTMVPQ